MIPQALLVRAAANAGEAPPPRPSAAWLRRRQPGSAAGIGLWVFIGVVSTLFTLFIVAYVMRAAGEDWSSIALPWQLWLSTGLLAAGGVALQTAAYQARRGGLGAACPAALAGAACTLAFIGVQLWAWNVLLARQVGPAGNPAASFFYLLSALHGLHVVGGLAAWGWVAPTLWRTPTEAPAWPLRLCARYWHFLFLLWIVLFATMGLLTPELARTICGVR